jgi:hypothetical protein
LQYVDNITGIYTAIKNIHAKFGYTDKVG